MRRLAVLALLLAGTAGCLGASEADQLRALNAELQRKNVDLAVKRMELERENDRLRAENRALKEKRGLTGEKAP